MNRPNITEGEWKVNGQEIIGNERNGYICTWSGRKANAKAISAVPEMIDALYGMYLSMMAHPDYQTGRNQEFIDYVEKAESALKKAGCHE